MHSRKKSSSAAESTSPEAADVWIEGREEELEAPEEPLLVVAAAAGGGGGDPTAKGPPPPPAPAATRAASGGLIEWMSSSAAVPPALPVLRCLVLLFGEGGRGEGDERGGRRKEASF
jgi:hypothetical protein